MLLPGALRPSKHNPLPRLITVAVLIFLTVLLSTCAHPAARHMTSVSCRAGVIAAVYSDREIQVWNATSGRLIRTITGGTGQYSAVTLSPGADLVAAGEDDGTVTLWNTTTGAKIHVLRGNGNDGWVYAIAFSPDGKLLAESGLNAHRSVRVWNVKTGTRMGDLLGSTDADFSVAFAPDGSEVAAGGDDGVVRLWNIDNGKELLRLTPRGGRVRSVAFSPDGRELAAGCENGRVALWSLPAGTLTRTLGERSDVLSSVCFSPSDNMLGSGSWDGRVSLWTLPAGKLLRVIRGSPKGVGWVFFLGGHELVTGGFDNKIHVWNLPAGTLLRSFAVPLPSH